MIITKTPFRMSFFGGGTDMPSFFETKKGAVLSTTFNKYCYVTVRLLPHFFDYSSEIVYSKIERVKDIADINHPAVRNAMEMLNIENIRLTYEADLPARTGLGTSSSFAVGMLNAFHCLKGQYVSKESLAKEAIFLERVLCAEAGGWQDQIASSFGGLNRIDFSNETFSVKPVIINPKRKKALNECLMLFFTGFTRFSAEIQKSNTYSKENKILDEMVQLVDVAESILIDGRQPLDNFGRLLGESWNLKRELGNKISTSSIDDFYKKAISAGALGGKLLGAGGGGFLLFYVDPDAQDSVRKALSDLLEVPFCFEEKGTDVVYYQPESLCNK